MGTPALAHARAWLGYQTPMYVHTQTVALALACMSANKIMTRQTGSRTIVRHASTIYPFGCWQDQMTVHRARYTDVYLLGVRKH